MISACNIQCHYHTTSASHPKNNTLVYLNHPHHPLFWAVCYVCTMLWVLQEKKALAFKHTEKSIVSEAGKQSQP